MRGRYLMQKVELLLSFCLLAPLWAALERALQLVRLGGQAEELPAALTSRQLLDCPLRATSCCK